MMIDLVAIELMVKKGLGNSYISQENGLTSHMYYEPQP